MKPVKLFFVVVLQFVFVAHTFAQYNIERLMERARKDIATNNIAEAIKKLNTCITSQPYNYEAYYLRGGCKFSLEDNLGAEQDFTTALSVYQPFYYDAFLYRSEVRYRLGNYAGAISDINKVIEKENTNPKLFLERAFAKLASNDYNGAISDCDKATNLNAIGEEVFLCKGTAKDALAEYDEALCEFDRAIQVNPRNEDSYVRRGITKYKMSNFKDAIDDYNQAIVIDSACTFAYYNRAEAEIKLENNKAALNDYNTVLSYEPGNAYAWFNRAILYSNMQKYKNAIEDFDKVLLLNPDNIQALFNRAKLKQNLKDYKNALKDFDKIIELYPYFMEAYYSKAQVKYLLNDGEGAKQDLATGKIMSEVLHSKNDSQLSRDSLQIAKLLKLNDDFNKPHINPNNDTININLRPLFYLAEKDSNNSNTRLYSVLVDAFNKKNHLKLCINNADPQSEPGMDSVNFITDDLKINLNNAIEKTNMQVLNAAHNDYDKLIKLDSTNALVYFARGINTCREIETMINTQQPYIVVNTNKYNFQNQQNEKYQSALADFNKALQLQPSFEYALYNRAYVKSLLHDYNGALNDYEKTIQLNPALAEAFYNKAYILYYLNDKQRACTAFSKAGELGLQASYIFIQKHCN